MQFYVCLSVELFSFQYCKFFCFAELVSFGKFLAGMKRFIGTRQIPKLYDFFYPRISLRTYLEQT